MKKMWLDWIGSCGDLFRFQYGNVSRSELPDKTH